MTTIRRLSDEDVRSLFESVYNGRQPPRHLKFSVVVVGPEGQGLSPPAYEFEDGLYILLEPRKKKSHPNDQPKVPPHLLDYVMTDTPADSCPWQLSGPQFPQPTAIQQRYCYPKGNPEYSSRKGGALWTMYGPDGKEKKEYRLLHVYFSAKRAVNKGVKSRSASSTPKKRAKTMSPPHKLPVRTLQSTPTSSPVSSFHAIPAALSPTISPIFRGNFVSPHIFEERSFHPVDEVESPFRPRALAQEDDSRDDLEARDGDATDDSDDHSSVQFDDFDFELMDTRSMQELEDACWSDPLFPPSDAPQDRLRSFADGLEKIHSTAREKIMAAPGSEQASLVSILSSWARQVAKDPLSDSNCEQV